MKRYIKTLAEAFCVLSLAVLPLGCERDQVATKSFTFNARCENINDGASGAKVRLANEQWIMWEYDDQVSIGSNATDESYYSSESNRNRPNKNCRAWLYYSSVPGDFEDYNGSFLAELPLGSKYFLALYPYSAQNEIIPAPIQHGDSSRFSTVKLNLPAVQTYRNDSSFDKQVYPMVAWYGGEWDGGSHSEAFNLNFRSLAGIVRLQFYNATSTAQTLSSITVTSATRQLSGIFSVDSIYGFNPRLVQTSSADADKKLTLDCSGISFPANELKSFYMVLPACQGRDATTAYNGLQVELTTAEGNSFSATLDVPVRRNGITYLNAVGVNSWRTTESTAERGLVGNGTSTRPFKVYTLSDLQYLRARYNSGERTINGQPITANTYIRIMRSDIAIRSIVEWPSGIRDFQGHLEYYGADNGFGGILNNTRNPLIENIKADGYVKGIVVKCDTNNLSSTTSISPLCVTNAGTIENCRVVSGSSVYGGINFSITNTAGGIGGVCVNNSGTIISSGCTAQIRCSGRRVSGICLVNTGTIKGCFTSTPMRVTAASRASSICDSNAGTIVECYHGAAISTESPMPWGGIAFSNNGTIKRCYASATGPIVSSSSVGGIVNTNYGGTIDECYNEAILKGKTVGGLVAFMRGGKLVNCYTNNTTLTLTQTNHTEKLYAAGMVAVMNGGSIENSFIALNQIESQNSYGVIGGMVGLLHGGTLKYCYVYEASSLSRSFYGEKDGGTIESTSYLVGASEAGVSSVDATAAGHNELFEALTGGSTEGYSEWVQPSAGALPVFAAIMPAKRSLR